MENKSYSLVAWTDKDGVRMIPSLVNELSEPYRQKIADLDEWDCDNEVRLLTAKSRAWEELGAFYLSVGYPRQSYRCYENAACVCTYCSDEYWRQSDDCDFPTLPLFYRFLSMHGRCKRLIEKHPFLRFEYEGSEMQRDYDSFTRDARKLKDEFDESYESIRAWNFGKGRR